MKLYDMINRCFQVNKDQWAKALQMTKDDPRRFPYGVSGMLRDALDLILLVFDLGLTFEDAKDLIKAVQASAAESEVE